MTRGHDLHRVGAVGPVLYPDGCRDDPNPDGSWTFTLFFEPDREHLELTPPPADPLTVKPDPKADRRGDWGCSVFVVAVAVFVWWLA